MTGFARINPIGEGTIRGFARLIVSPGTIAFPSKLADMINVLDTDEGYEAAVQTLTASGTPTAGTFTLAFQSVETAPLPWDATATQVADALNRLGGISSEGGVTCTGGPLAGGSAAAVVITFGVDGLQPLIAIPTTGLSLTPSGASISIAATTPGNGQYDITPSSGWNEVGSTRSGTQATRNNTETQLDVDQIKSAITAIPDEWEMTVATQLAETTLENIQLAWEGGDITVDVTTTPNERHLALGAPEAYTQRRLAVLHQKTIGPAAGRIRAVVYRQVLHSTQNSTLDYQKTGQMQTLPVTFRAFADWTISDPNARFAEIIEQEAI